jgi:hypothetical protein
MTASRLPFMMISKAQRDSYLDNGYNAPAVDASREEFNDESGKVIDELRERIGEVWKHDAVGGDCFMPGGYTDDRLLCVEIANREMLSARLLEIVHDVVVTLQPNYSVDICDAWQLLETEDGEPYPHFNIFVEKTRVLIYSESEALLRRLGVVT